MEGLGTGNWKEMKYLGKVHNCDENVAGEGNFMSELKGNVIFKSQQFCSQ